MLKILFTISIFLFSYHTTYVQEKTDSLLRERALKLHLSSIVVDTHCDVTERLLTDKKFDIGKRNVDGHLDLIRMKEGGLTAEFFSIYIRNDDDNNNPSAIAFRSIDTVRNAISRYQALAAIATSSTDIRRLKKEGKCAILMGMENGSPVESLPLVQKFYDLGIRYITLTHVRNNKICDSSTDKDEKWGGLSPYGKQVIAEMNKYGIMVDVSHISDKAAMQAIALSSKPVIASHSACRALCRTRRNISDSLLLAVKKNNGVVMVNFYPVFLDAAYKDKYNEAQKKHTNMKIDPPPASKIVDHIEHVINVAGIDHVGLGSDFDGINVVPVGMEDVSKLPFITYELLRRGHSESEIKKILGENILRVMEANEKH